MFLLIMGLVFFLTFTVGDALKGYFEIGLDWLSGHVAALLNWLGVAEWLKSLIVDGIIAGVDFTLDVLRRKIPTGPFQLGEVTNHQYSLPFEG